MRNFIQSLRASVNRLRETLFKGLFRARYRYDVFISYSHSDAKDYAVNLKEQLAKLDFACFIDKEEAPPGLSLGPTLEKALKKSAVLVLLATDRALTRPYIALEFERFVTAKRKIIPINMAGALTKNNEAALTKAPWNIINEQKLIWLDESEEAFAKQRPSPPIADGIDKLFKYTRRNVRVRAEVIGTAVLVLLAAFGAGFVIKGQAAEVSKQASLAEIARQETKKQQDIAARAGEEAERQLKLAQEAKDEAAKQGKIAEDARDEATRQQEIAKEATTEATKQQLLARKATLEAERQQAIAEQQLERSRHLVYDSDLNLAQRAQERGDMTQLNDFLKNHGPTGTGKDYRDRRGFEWFYYWRLANYKPETLGSVNYVGLMEISHDGKVLAAVSNDSAGQLKIWRLDSKESVEVKAHRDRITGLSISVDGTMVATASADTTVKLWDIRNRNVNLIKTLRNSPVGVASVVLSRDGKKLATGNFDKTVRLWDIEKEMPLMTSKPYSESVFYPVISPDGNTLVTYDDKSIRFQSTNPPYQVIDELLTNEKISCVSFSADGKKLIAGVSNNKVRIMEWPDWRNVRLVDALGRACPVAVDRDASIIATVSDKIYLWNVLPWSTMGSFNVDGWYYQVALTPDGKKVAIRDSASVKLWDIYGVQEHATLYTENGADQIAFSRSGKMFAMRASKTVSFWDIEKRSELPGLKESAYGAEAMALSDDGRIATGYGNGTVKIWNIETRKPLLEQKMCAEQVLALSFSPNGETLAAGCSNGKVELWNTRSQKSLVTLNGHAGSVRAVVFSSDGRLASAGDDKTVRMWQVNGQQLWVGTVHQDAIVELAFSFDGNRLASASKDKTVKLWEVSTGKDLVTLLGHQFEVTAVAFSPDGKTVATGGEDKTVKLWDPNTGQQLTTFSGHEAPVAAVAFSPDGKTLATGSWDRTVRLWFAATDEQVNAALRDNRSRP